MHSLLLVTTLVSSLVGFTLCAIPFGLVISEHFYNIDVRKHGSGNTGFTNVLRTCGVAPGVATLVLDILKSVLSLFIAIGLQYFVIDNAFLPWTPGFYDSPYVISLTVVYISCIFGHIFSPFLKFKGGKGVTTGFAGMLPVMPLTSLCSLIVFLITIFATKFVSLGSIFATISLPVFAYIIYRPPLIVILLISMAALVVLWAHRENIVRLRNGNERKISAKN